MEYGLAIEICRHLRCRTADAIAGLSNPKQRGAGIMNAAPFAARLLTNTDLPKWHKATPRVREIAKKAAEHAASKGIDIAQLAVQFSIENHDIATCIVRGAIAKPYETPTSRKVAPKESAPRQESPVGLSW